MAEKKEEMRVVRVVIPKKYYDELEKEAKKEDKPVPMILSEKVIKQIFERKKRKK